MLLRNDRMNDGSRCFASLPQTASWEEVRNQIRDIPGAEVVGFLSDGVTEAWIDFTFQGHKFTINDQMGEYWFFVESANCPDAALREILGHFDNLSSSQA